MKIKIKKTESEQWNKLSELTNGELGDVTTTELWDGTIHYNANFPKYGGLVLGIPETVVEVAE